MNASLATLLTAVGAVAASAVLALALAEPDGTPLPQGRVLAATQGPAEQLPRVVVEGRRGVDGLELAGSAGSADRPLVE